MRQATGKTNPPESGYKVSIQQSLDGHSFSLSPLPELSDPETELEVEVLTPRTQLVPTDLFAADRAAELLSAAGFALRTDERAVWSSPVNEAVALMVVPDSLVKRLEGHTAHLRYSSPLLAMPGLGEKSVWCCCKGSLIYIKVYGATNRLLLAEVIPAQEDSEICYFFERMTAVFPLEEYRLHLTGMVPKKLRKRIGGLFKKTTCA
ncbi:hypothetical protein [Alistipes sp.]|uniref:hypothetical protein n=1 Tax=Alistipes sp. TaxID=1872444 RepID=UPI0025BEB576|nr:hypothetical protein [Alistipes sp.]MCI7140359.1 hypothetical protein [Alistipes sp.]MDY5397608.1 hypothetical protein [Alistipes sp.]